MRSLNPESQTDAQNMIFCEPTYFGAEAWIEKMQSKTETRQKNVYVFAEIQNPKQMRKI